MATVLINQDGAGEKMVMMTVPDDSTSVIAI